MCRKGIFFKGVAYPTSGVLLCTPTLGRLELHDMADRHDEGAIFHEVLRLMSSFTKWILHTAVHSLSGLSKQTSMSPADLQFHPLYC